MKIKSFSTEKKHYRVHNKMTRDREQYSNYILYDIFYVKTEPFSFFFK